LNERPPPGNQREDVPPPASPIPVRTAFALSDALRAEPARDAERGLVAELRRGDPIAVGAAYDAHHAAVRALSRRLVGDAAAAEDLVHDVFTALPSAARRFQEGSSLRTFLLGIAVNHARHHVRSAARRRAAMERFAREPSASPTDPERAAERADLARALTVALDELPLEQRVAFVLCEVEGRSSPEAAEITGAPEATIRTRVFHARQKLRAALERRGIR